MTSFANYPEFNYEKVLEANPDFILSGSSYDTEVPKKLNPIAPTYNYNGFDGADWRTHFKKTAEALNRTEQYQAWMDKYQARIDEVKAKIKAAGIDPVVANMSFSTARSAWTATASPAWSSRTSDSRSHRWRATTTDKARS